MPDYTHQIFLSYARKDNLPTAPAAEGWVTAFEREIKRRHAAYSGRELKIFFDTEVIAEGVDWQRRLGQGLRSSKLFLAFLSPNYLTSPNCLWEWEEYLRREHSSARGDDGLTPIFFVTPNDLRLEKDQHLTDWLSRMEKTYPWFKADANRIKSDTETRARSLLTDMDRRNRTQGMELHPWFDAGPEVLKRLDARARSQIVKGEGRDDTKDFRLLNERLQLLDRHIARRLDRMTLAGLAPGNSPRSHEHFVGRHQELRRLHTIMMTGGAQSGGSGMGGRGLIAAAFSPGGLGKTALARQYAHAYAEFYAAGGRWEIPCEGKSDLGSALLGLADSTEFQRLAVAGFDPQTQQVILLEQPLQLTDDQRAQPALAMEAILDYLQRVTVARVAHVKEQLCQDPDRRSKPEHLPELEQPRALLILDNVDKPELLSASQIAALPPAEWLEIIVTTRLDPGEFGSVSKFSLVEVPTLSEEESLTLIKDFQKDNRLTNTVEEQASREIVRLLDGYTLAIEIVAAYLGNSTHRVLPSEYLKKLKEMGLAHVDEHAAETKVSAQIRHRKNIAQNHIKSMVSWTLQNLTPHARTALEFASLLNPSEIPLDWLVELTLKKQREAPAPAPGLFAKISHFFGKVPTASTYVEESPATLSTSIWRELYGLRLIHPAHELEDDSPARSEIPCSIRIHRLIAEQIRALTSDKTGMLASIDALLFQISADLEAQHATAEVMILPRLHHCLREQLVYCLANHPNTRALLLAAQIVASREGDHLSLYRGLELTSLVLKIREAILATNPASRDAARDLSVSLQKMGDLLLRRGYSDDVKMALECYTRSNDIFEKLIGNDKSDIQAAYDSSLSLYRLGDFFVRSGNAGDREKALDFYHRSLAMSEKVYSLVPELDEVVSRLALSLECLADFHSLDLSNGGQALEYYKRSLELRRTIYSKNPGSSEAAHGVACSYGKLGEFYSRRNEDGDFDAAMQCFQTQLDIMQQVCERNPDSMEYRRSYNIALDHIASTHSRTGDVVSKLQSLERINAELSDLFHSNANSAEVSRDYAVSLIRLGDFYEDNADYRDLDKAIEYFNQSQFILSDLHQANQNYSQFALDLALAQLKLGDACIEREGAGDLLTALSCYEKSYKTIEKQSPSDHNLRLLANAATSMARAYLMQDHESATTLQYLTAATKCREQLVNRNPSSLDDINLYVISLRRLADYLGLSDENEDTDAAIISYQTAIKICESIFAVDASSESIFRELKYQLDKCAHLLVRRGNLRDADSAYEQYKLITKLHSQYLKAVPPSPKVAFEFYDTLERTARFMAEHLNKGDEALALQLKALTMTLDLAERDLTNPVYQRISVTALYNTYLRAHDAGNESLTSKYAYLCFLTLNSLMESGSVLDHEMVALHDQLKRLFAND